MKSWAGQGHLLLQTADSAEATRVVDHTAQPAGKLNVKSNLYNESLVSALRGAMTHL